MTIKSRKFFSLGLAGALLSILAPPVSALTPMEVAKLLADDAEAGDRFGFSVAVDGDTALIGAFLHDDAGSSSGSAYVFTRDGMGNWSQQAKLTAGDAAADDQFGFSVSVAGDTALIGAPLDDDDVAGNASGSAYVFMRSGTTWTQQAKLTADDDADVNDNFGNSVSVDGDTALIGAHFNDDASNDSGSAYVFTRDGMGNWSQQAKLTADDAATLDEFGYSVSVAGDTALIGARLDDDAFTNSGSAYVFSLVPDDIDNDGVDDNDDFCPDTLIPESVPTKKLNPNHWALMTNNVFVFDTAVTKGNGNGRSYTTSDTAGCSCEQIIAVQGLGKGHTEFGCSEGTMQEWIDQFN